MPNRARAGFLLIGLFVGACAAPAPAFSNEVAEKAGMAIGMTAGNIIVAPLKATALALGLVQAALSYVFFGGDKELTEQISQNTAGGPYFITPEIARKAVGERPEKRNERSGVSLKDRSAGTSLPTAADGPAP